VLSSRCPCLRQRRLTDPPIADLSGTSHPDNCTIGVSSILIRIQRIVSGSVIELCIHDRIGTTFRATRPPITGLMRHKSQQLIDKVVGKTIFLGIFQGRMLKRHQNVNDFLFVLTLSPNDFLVTHAMMESAKDPISSGPRISFPSRR